LQGRSQDPLGNDFRHTFHVIKAFLVMPRFLPSGSDGSERRQVVVHPPRGRCLGFTVVPEDHTCQGYRALLPTEHRGSGPSVALCRSGSRGSSGTRRGAAAAAACAEAQRQQSELDQVTGERDQSRGWATEAESRAEALGVQLAEASARAGALASDLAVAQAASSEQRARAEGMSWLF
jgi:predicted nucleic acid-binding Zn ribbon protein